MAAPARPSSELGLGSGRSSSPWRWWWRPARWPPSRLGPPTYGARTTADEPQYLLSAISLAEDRDLDISDELRRAALARLPRGRAAPADRAARRRQRAQPARPAAAAAPRGADGDRRLGGREGRARRCWPALLAAVLLGRGPPLRGARRRSRPAPCSPSASRRRSPSYGTQVYPELPGRAGRHGRGRRRSPVRSAGAGAWSLGLAVVALPWLAVKYAPVAAALVGRRRWSAAGARATDGAALVLVGVLGVAGVVFLAPAPGDLRRLDRLRRRRPLRRRRVHRRRVVAPTTWAGRCGWSACSSTAASGSLAWAPVFLLTVAGARRARCGAGPPGWAALVVPARGRLGQRHLGRAHDARLVVARPPGGRDRAAAGAGHRLVGRPPPAGPARVLVVAAVAGFVLWGWLRRRGAAAPAHARRRLRGAPATRSPGRGGRCCRTTGDRAPAPGRSRRLWLADRWPWWRRGRLALSPR